MIEHSFVIIYNEDFAYIIITITVDWDNISFY